MTQASNVLISDQGALKRKLDLFKNGGLENIHVVADFDRTLTKSLYNGRKTPSLIALIREGGYLSDDYTQKAFALFDEYHPVEMDTRLPLEYRYQKMEEWWKKHMELLVESGVTREVIDDIVSKHSGILREGTLKFLNALNTKNIPLLIFSAGIGNIIEAILKENGCMYDNIHIIANFFFFDVNGKAIGFNPKLIHTLNKSEVEIQNEAYLEAIRSKKHVLLLGDSLGDIGMTEGLAYEEIIRIGFLNDEIDKRLLDYSAAFDVLITQDGNLEYVNNLLENFLQNNREE